MYGCISPYQQKGFWLAIIGGGGICGYNLIRRASLKEMKHFVIVFSFRFGCSDVLV